MALVAPTAGSAWAATGSPAYRDTAAATSQATLLTLSVAGHTLKALDVTLRTSTRQDPASAAVTVVPVTLDGVASGEVALTQDSGDQPALASQTATVPGVLGVTTPGGAMRAQRTADGVLATIGTSSLGQVSLLGLDLPALAGAFSTTSVVATDLSSGTKTLKITDLALPGIGELLAALGLDLGALPVATLHELVTTLNLGTTLSGALKSISDAAVAAQQAVDAAQAELDAKTAELAAATQDATAKATAAADADAVLAAAQTQLAQATAALAAALPLDPLLPTLEAAVTAATADVAAAQSAASAASAALAAAQQAVAVLQAAVDALQATLTTLLSTLTQALSALQGFRPELVAVLDQTPLAALDSLDLTMLAKAGPKHDAFVKGTVTGLRVLGTDVLKSALGSSSVDVLSLLDGTLAKVQTTIDALTGTLSSVLSSVPDFAALKVPAPSVQVLQREKASHTFGAASAGITALSLSWPGIELPASLAVPGAADLPVLETVSPTLFRSSALALDLGTFVEAASFVRTPVAAPAAPPAAPPGTAGPTLPMTGGSPSLAVLAALLLAAAYGVRRVRPGSTP